MRGRFVLVLFGFFVLFSANPTAAGSNIVGTCVDVIDGDTIVVEIDGKSLTVSLPAVDAPELDQPFGDEAKSFTAELVLDREVTVEAVPGGSPTETVGRVVIGETDLEAALVDQGLAWHDAIHDSQERLVVKHIMARSAKRGLWNGADPVAPWDWRVAHAPTPVPRKKKKLADMAGDVELEKNADGKTVVTQPKPSSAGASAGSGGPAVTNSLGKEMCCCEVKTVTVDRNGEESEEEYIYQWQEKYACEHNAIQIIEATGTMNFFERCVNRSYCPAR